MRLGMQVLCVLMVLFCVGVVCRAADGAKATDDGFKREHFAFASGFDYLDGPRLESYLDRHGRYLSSDPDGNWYIMWKFSTSWIRVIRDDGMVETIAGGNHWTPNFGLSEGPAAYLPNMSMMPTAGDLYVPGFGIQVAGSPLKGEDEGCVYVFFRAYLPYKVYKNKEKNDRWWFKRLGTPKGTKLPTTRGESISLSEADLYEAGFSGPNLIRHKYNLYEINEAEDKITCIVGIKDLKSRIEEASLVTGLTDTKGSVKPSHYARGEDGTIYIAYYFNGFGRRAFKLSADQSKLECIVFHDSRMGDNRDGPGLRTGWHCGPSKVIIGGKNTPLFCSVDSGSVRRWVDGRVSVLCYDGEWREKNHKVQKLKSKDVRSKVYQTAGFALPYVYLHYCGEEMGGDFRGYRVGPVDFEKPTVGPLVPDDVAVAEKGEKR